MISYIVNKDEHKNKIDVTFRWKFDDNGVRIEQGSWNNTLRYSVGDCLLCEWQGRADAATSTSATSAVTCTAAATPEPIITLDSSGTCASDSSHLPSPAGCSMPIEVMICWCYPLHLFVWTRRQLLARPTDIHFPPSSTGAPARSAPVISCALNCTSSQRRTHQNAHLFFLFKWLGLVSYRHIGTHFVL